MVTDEQLLQGLRRCKELGTLAQVGQRPGCLLSSRPSPLLVVLLRFIGSALASLHWACVGQ